MHEQQELLFTEPCPQTLLHFLAPLMGKWSNITESNPRMSSMLKCLWVTDMLKVLSFYRGEE